MATYPRTSNRSVPSGQALLLVLLLTLPGLLGCSASTPTSTRGLKGTISEFPLPTSNSPSGGITAGPDGNLWFTEITPTAQSATTFTGKIGRITPAGQLREFPLLAPNSELGAITTGPDGALWFTELVATAQSGKIVDEEIGRITPLGTIREFSLSASNSVLMSITTGPDGALWFTEDSSINGQSGKIGRLA